jgi:hypothetical protein
VRPWHAPITRSARSASLDDEQGMAVLQMMRANIHAEIVDADDWAP